MKRLILNIALMLLLELVLQSMDCSIFEWQWWGIVTITGIYGTVNGIGGIQERKKYEKSSY